MPVDQVAQGVLRVFCDQCFAASRSASTAEEAAARATAAGWKHAVWSSAEGDADEAWMCPRCAKGVAHAA